MGWLPSDGQRLNAICSSEGSRGGGAACSSFTARMILLRTVDKRSNSTSLIALDLDNDLAVMSATPDNVPLLGARTLALSLAAVHSAQEVQVWGFPGTASIQLSPRWTVTEIGSGFLVLAGSLGAGYSGGPVVSDADVVGVVVRDDGTQARFVTADRIQALLNNFAVRS